MSAVEIRSEQEIRERISIHEDFAKKCLRNIHTNPQLVESSGTALAIAMNQLEELHWVLGEDWNMEAMTKYAKQEKHED